MAVLYAKVSVSEVPVFTKKVSKNQMSSSNYKKMAGSSSLPVPSAWKSF